MPFGQYKKFLMSRFFVGFSASAIVLALLLVSCSKDALLGRLGSINNSIGEEGENYGNPGDSHKNVNGESHTCPNTISESINSGEKRVYICHKSSSDKKSNFNLFVGESSVEDHMSHGDYKGCCK